MKINLTWIGLVTIAIAFFFIFVKGNEVYEAFTQTTEGFQTVDSIRLAACPAASINESGMKLEENQVDSSELCFIPSSRKVICNLSKDMKKVMLDGVERAIPSCSEVVSAHLDTRSSFCPNSKQVYYKNEKEEGCSTRRTMNSNGFTFPAQGQPKCIVYPSQKENDERMNSCKNEKRLETSSFIFENRTIQPSVKKELSYFSTRRNLPAIRYSYTTGFSPKSCFKIRDVMDVLVYNRQDINVELSKMPKNISEGLTFCEIANSYTGNQSKRITDSNYQYFKFPTFAQSDTDATIQTKMATEFTRAFDEQLRQEELARQRAAAEKARREAEAKARQEAEARAKAEKEARDRARALLPKPVTPPAAIRLAPPRPAPALTRASTTPALQQPQVKQLPASKLKPFEYMGKENDKDSKTFMPNITYIYGNITRDGNPDFGRARVYKVSSVKTQKVNNKNMGGDPAKGVQKHLWKSNWNIVARENESLTPVLNREYLYAPELAGGFGVPNISKSKTIQFTRGDRFTVTNANVGGDPAPGERKFLWVKA